MYQTSPKWLVWIMEHSQKSIFMIKKWLEKVLLWQISPKSRRAGQLKEEEDGYKRKRRATRRGIYKKSKKQQERKSDKNLTCIYPLKPLFESQEYSFYAYKALIQLYLSPIIFVIFPLWIIISHPQEISCVDLEFKASFRSFLFLTPYSLVTIFFPIFYFQILLLFFF